MAIHDGHRQRLRERFIQEGLDNFDEINVLELLLFYAIPRIDTNDIAHRLLDAFGSLDGVLDANVDDLAKVQGMGKNSAVFLSLLSSTSRYYQKCRVNNIRTIKSVEDCGQILQPMFSGRRNEQIYLLCLDIKSKILCIKLISEGSVNSTSVSLRKIVEAALAVNASAVIMAHNHPSGLAVPSAEDVMTTQKVARALNAVDIRLLDHLVFSDDEFISMVQSGLYTDEVEL